MVALVVADRPIFPYYLFIEKRPDDKYYVVRVASIHSALVPRNMYEYESLFRWVEKPARESGSLHFILRSVEKAGPHSEAASVGTEPWQLVALTFWME